MERIMVSAKTCRNAVYLIVPFAYETNYDNILQSTIISDNWEDIELSKREHIFEHIDSLVAQKEGSHDSIGKVFSLKKSARKHFGLLEDANKTYFYQSNDGKVADDPFSKDKLSFTIPKIELYLFETQIGFLLYKVEFAKKTSINDISRYTYYLKSFSKEFGQCFYKTNALFDEFKNQGLAIDGKTVRIKTDSTVEDILEALREAKPDGPYDNLDMVKLKEAEEKQHVKIKWGRLTANLLEFTLPLTYFEDFIQDEIKQPHYALTFMTATLDESFMSYFQSDQDELVKKSLFQMRRSFKGSYKPSAIEYDLDHNDEVFQAFENSYWGISLEGLANLTHVVNDSKTNQFITGNYYGNLERCYLYIYLLALHQRYALIYSTIQASKLPKKIETYLDPNNEESINRLEELKGKIVSFTLRCSYRQVSSVTHQAKIYEMMRSTLKIEELMDELHFELDTFMQITAMQNDKRLRKIQDNDGKMRDFEDKTQRVKDKYSQRFQLLMLIITSIFVTVSTVNDANGALPLFKEIYPLWPHHTLGWAILVILLLMAVGFFIYIVWMIIQKIEIRRLREKLLNNNQE